MTPRLTRAQRKERRRRGPFRNAAGDLRETGGAIVAEFRYAVHEASALHGAIVAALNAIAETPEPVARAEAALLRAALAYGSAKTIRASVRCERVLNDRADSYARAVKAAKKEKGR